MSSDSETVTSEEPFPGWIRYERPGEKPWYKTPVPRKVIRNAKMLSEFLAKERLNNRMIDVDEGLFSFKRRYGLRVRSVTLPPAAEEQNVEVTISPSIVERLSRRSDVGHLDHRKLLSGSAKLLDQFRDKDCFHEPQDFEELKHQIATSTDLRDMLVKLSRSSSLKGGTDAVFVDSCLAEVSKLSTKCGPLAEFPASVNVNLYCKIVEQAMKECPTLTLFVIKIVTRRGEPVMPSHVLKVATLFSSICYATNQELNAISKLRSLTLQVDGLSNVGIDMLSDVGLAQCARSIANYRDQFADIGTEVMNSTCPQFPYQSTLDNCDFLSEHLTVETIEKVIITHSIALFQ